MTKIIILGEEPQKKEQKKIEFRKVLSDDFIVDSAFQEPCSFENIELICKDYSRGFDLMFAYSSPKNRGLGVLYIGHFNDGVV
jgi:hypothetical protein